VVLMSWHAFLPTGGGRGRQRLLHCVEGSGGGGNEQQPLNSLLDFLHAEIIEHLLERWEGHHVCEDGVEVFEVLVQPAQDVQHGNTVGDVNAEVRKGVHEALHLSIVAVDAEVALNKALEGGIDVEGAGFMVAEEVVLQGQPGIMSRVVALLGDVLQVGGDGVIDPRLDDVVHSVPRRRADVRGVY
jgi:hypothetical protein